MGRGTPSRGRGAARNNNNTYENRGGGQNRNNKLDVSALGLVPSLGGARLSPLSALHQTAGVGGLGGLQQATQLRGLLGGCTALTGGVSNELAGLCALLGGSQLHDVTLNATQVLQVQHAMAAQATAKQKEAEALLQAKIDAEVEKMTLGLVMLPPWCTTPGHTKNQDHEDQRRGPRRRCPGFASVRSVEAGEAPEETC